MTEEYWIPGEPATFATSGEKPWRQRIAETLAGTRVSATGLSLKFVLPSSDIWKLKADLDNFCEPVLSVLINRLGWIGGQRPNLDWWHAEKRIGEPTGLLVSTELEGPSHRIAKASTVIFDGRYTGKLPKSATEAGIPEWIDSLGRRRAHRLGPIGLCLEFADRRINLGDIATGPVKSVIDCLYPIVGGQERAPEDWRINYLLVTRRPSSVSTGLHIIVFRMD